MLLNRLYQTLWRIAPPFIRHYLRRRARLAPAYLAHWDERFGHPYPDPVRGALWIHAVSVGETRAAQPLIAALQQQLPDLPLLITQTTPTGRATAEALYPQAQCRYLPYDKRDYVDRFLQEHAPRLGILMETEIWPNTLNLCHQKHIPLFMANARLSAKSERGYLKAYSLMAPALQTISACYAQTEADATRLRRIGAANVRVLGNSKYDITPPEPMHTLAAQFKKRIGTRAVVVAASTRFYQDEDEALLLLKAWRTYQGQALLVIVPRHPERFDAVAKRATALGYRTQKRSDDQAVAADTQVWIGDSMGELFAYLLAADVVFVGGSLVNSGCHNLIEPIACGKPTLFGPSTYNFAEAAASAVACQAALQIHSAEQWQQHTIRLINDSAARLAMAEQAHTFIHQHQGASQRMANAIATAITASAAQQKNHSTS